ncbi:TIGR03986 family CRISPR-associated RAMP protein [Rhodobacter lacus]|uniref:TIGR03986 family CRISPR-associated RAMP protein n=1 Tax=Rhodobacter lacus TaxID=1641972 RepID=A0ABW5A9W7_9RHOB
MSTSDKPRDNHFQRKPRHDAPRHGTSDGAKGQNAPVSYETPPAPFRFIPLPEQVKLAEPEVRQAWEAGTLHSHPLPAGLSGSLTVEIMFDGPMLVGGPATGAESEAQQVRPVRLGQDYVLPGSTLRGLLRSVTELVSASRIRQMNLHRRYGIRDFSHPLFKDTERKRPRAGWLRLVDKKPVLQETEWYEIRIRDLMDNANSGQFHYDWLNKSIGARYSLVDRVDPENSKRFNFDTPTAFAKKGNQAHQVVPQEGGNIDGVFVFSNASPTSKDLSISTLDMQDKAKPRPGHFKKTEAVFAHEPFGAPQAIPDAVWETFELNNSSPSRHKPEREGNWKELWPTLKAGGRIPVFWLSNADLKREPHDHAVADFGLVRVFKRAHLYSVKDTLERTDAGAHLTLPGSPDYQPDLTEALFGYVHEPETTSENTAALHKDRHLASRLGFGFGYLSSNADVRPSDTWETVQSAPKPSFGPYYLAQGQHDWSDATSTLAGVKTYPARGADESALKSTLQSWIPSKGNAARNTKIRSKLVFLLPRSRGEKITFTAEIRFHNVTSVELGALIWAMTFGGNPQLRHMIGRAKAAGAGQARITPVAIELRYGTPDTPEVTAFCAARMQDFETFMGADWRESETVQALLAWADPAQGRALGRARQLSYLPLPLHRKLRDHARRSRKPRLLDHD